MARKLFVVALYASREKTVGRTITIDRGIAPAYVLASSPEEAKLQAQSLNFCQFPAALGWRFYQTFVLEVPSEVIAQVHSTPTSTP